MKLNNIIFSLSIRIVLILSLLIMLGACSTINYGKNNTKEDYTKYMNSYNMKTVTLDNTLREAVYVNINQGSMQ